MVVRGRKARGGGGDFLCRRTSSKREKSVRLRLTFLSRFEIKDALVSQEKEHQTELTTKSRATRASSDLI